MSSQQKTVDYLVDQITGAGDISSRKMFGEYAIYCDGKVIALVCDDKLFIKPTEGGKAFIGSPEEGNPYPGSRPYFHIPGDIWDDKEWMVRLVEITAAEVPLPKPKKKR